MTPEELKAILERDGKLTADLQEKFETMSKDVVHIDEYKKLEAEVAKVAKERAEAETRHTADLAEVKALAEESAIKAGRKGTTGDGDGLSEAQREHKTAFIAYLRNREDPAAIAALKEAETKAVDTQTGAAGGFAVPQEIDRAIQSKVMNEAVMRPLVKVATVGTSDYKELVDKGGMGFGWVGETGARTDTATPSLYEVTPAMGTLYAYPKATEEALDDAFFDVERWLADEALVAFANGEDTAIVAGTGTNQPLGFLATTPLVTADGARTDKVIQYLPTGVAADWGADPQKNLIDLVYTVKAGYRAGASWLMNSLTTAKVRVLQDANGRMIWTDSLAAGEPPMLLGYPVHACEAMPDFAAAAHPIAFGDYRRGYTLVDRHGLRVTRDDVTTPGYVKWNIRRRVGGAVTNDDAIKVLKVSLT